jgi:hypothetical protein
MEDQLTHRSLEALVDQLPAIVPKEGVILFRTIARSLLIVTTLAYMLALGQLAHGRMLGSHSAAAHDHAQLSVICAEHGLQRPEPDGPGHKPPHQCTECAVCTVQAVQVAATRHADPADWPVRVATVHAEVDFKLPKPRGPPGLSARGPPVLI